MANKVYPKYKKAAAGGAANSNLLTGTIKIALIDTGLYTYDDAHEFMSDVPALSRIAISGAVTSKSLTDLAAFLSSNAHFAGPVSGASIEGFIIFVDTGVDATSRLVAFEDVDVIGLPETPVGGSYNLIMDSTGWFIL